LDEIPDSATIPTTDTALTGKPIKGRRYQRRSEVDLQIREATHLTPDELVRRARSRDKKSSQFLSEETLVYFIRQLHSTGQHSARDQLIEMLMARYSKIVHRRVSALSISRDDALSEVTVRLFRRILALNPGLAEYLQVNFWSALKAITFDVCRKYPVKFAPVFGELDPLPPEAKPGVAKKTQSPALVDMDTEIEEVESLGLSVEEIASIDEALNTIPEPARTAFILYHYFDLPITSIKSNADTISRRFGKSDKTISTWLKIAEDHLEKWRRTDV